MKYDSNNLQKCNGLSRTTRTSRQAGIKATATTYWKPFCESLSAAKLRIFSLNRYFLSSSLNALDSCVHARISQVKQLSFSSSDTARITSVSHNMSICARDSRSDELNSRNTRKFCR